MRHRKRILLMVQLKSNVSQELILLFWKYVRKILNYLELTSQLHLVYKFKGFSKLHGTIENFLRDVSRDNIVRNGVQDLMRWELNFSLFTSAPYLSLYPIGKFRYHSVLVQNFVTFDPVPFWRSILCYQSRSEKCDVAAVTPWFAQENKSCPLHMPAILQKISQALSIWPSRTKGN